VSRLVDLRRREDAHDAAIERGKAKLRLLQAVLTHFTEGLTSKASSERLGLGLSTVEKYRSFLELARRRVDVGGQRRGG
jgi:DNA-binding NarL/FixJ family response regulator